MTSQIIVSCRHFDISTTGELTEVREGLALAFIEQMVTRDQLWITSTVRRVVHYGSLHVYMLIEAASDWMHCACHNKMGTFHVACSPASLLLFLVPIYSR